MRRYSYAKMTFLALMLITILVGCNESGNNLGQVEPKEHIEPNLFIDNISYDELGLSKYKEVVTLSFVREFDDNFESFISNFPGETIYDNRWTQLYEQVLGIKIQYDWLEKKGLYDQRLSSAIAVGDIPDVIKVNAQQLRLLSNAGLIQDLTEAYKEYATPFTKEVFMQQGIDLFSSAMIDGKLMGIPEMDSLIERAEFLWIRTDWLAHLDLEPPRTMADVLAIAKAFTEEDPDQNGRDDTFGLAVANHLWDPVMGLEAFMAGYNAFPNIWIEDGSGQLVFGAIRPEVKEALQVLQTMYQEGLIDPEFMFKDGIKAAKLVADSRVGMLYGEQWGSFFPIQPSKENGDAEWQAFPIVSDSGELAKVPLRSSYNNYYAVRKDIAYPEALVKLFNLHLEKNWGKTADYDVYYSTPYPAWQLSPVTPFPAAKNLDAYRQLAIARFTGDQTILNAEARAVQHNINAYLSEDDITGWGWYQTYGPTGAFAILDQYERNNQLLYEGFLGAKSETMIHSQPILKELQHDVFLNIILGEPIANFDQFVEDWLMLGGDKMTEEVNGWYATRGE